MFELWFGIVAVMLTGYVVLDGYDLGAGVLHLLVARTGEERRQVLAAVGPFWDANEVWLLAAGGALFVAFPRVLAAGLSGFYLAIFLVLWMLILRAVSIEFRSHLADGLWRRLWDTGFTVASAALAKVSPVITPRQGGDRFGRLLAGLGNRDGYYVMLIAFVVALSALPAALPFLMGLVAAGSHAYWLGRAAYALRRR